jgi:hypothetical protein
MNPEEIQKALTDPNSKVMVAELTPELKARLERITCEVIDLLQKRCMGPGEAVMALHFVMETFKETYGITGAFTQGEDEHGKA